MGQPGNLVDLFVLAVSAVPVVAGVAVLRGHLWIVSGYAREADVDDRRAARVGGGLLVGVGVATAGSWVVTRTGVLGPDQVVAVAFLGIGLLLLGLGVAVRRGNTWLLSNYDPRAVDDEQRVARLAGGGLAALGAVTLVMAVAMGAGLVAPTNLGVWAGWTVLVLVVVFGLTGVVSGGAQGV